MPNFDTWYFGNKFEICVIFHHAGNSDHFSIVNSAGT